MKRQGAPVYRVIGGTRFFGRAEVKDMLAYLCVINNRADDLRLARIINNPPRGIGAKTLEMASRLASSSGIPLYGVVSSPGNCVPRRCERAAGKLQAFCQIIEDCAALLGTIPLPGFLRRGRLPHRLRRHAGAEKRRRRAACGWIISAS